MCEKKILKFIEDNRENIIKDTIDLIGIPSISTNRIETEKALIMALDKAREMGFKTSSLLENSIGIIEFGEGDETIGILAHVDVVGIDEDEKWEFPPFKGTYNEGFICGRGAMDDKGPLIASLYAMKAIMELGLPYYKKVQLIIGTQEEVEWTDMKAYTDNFPLPDYGFTPDGEFPLTNREKGYADINIKFEKDLGRDRDFEVILLEGGTAINTVPSVAKAVLRGDFEKFKENLKLYMFKNPEDHISFTQSNNLIFVTAEGIATHSCFPEKGKNAISILCRFLNSLSISTNGSERLIEFVSKYLANDIYGKSLGLYEGKEYMNGEYMHRTVISPTILKSDENSYNLSLNLRTVFGSTKEDIINTFDKFKQEYDYSYFLGEYMDPIYVSKDRPFINIMANAYEEVSGYKNDFALAYGTSYAKAMNNFVSWGPVFPGDTDYCHETNERISLENLIKASKIYACALAKMVTVKEALK